MHKIAGNGGPDTGKRKTTLTDLPPELLDHVTTYLPAAQSLKDLASTSRDLNTFVEKDAWTTFSRTRFPSLNPNNASQAGKDVARSLTTLSRAWDRRAFVSRYIEPYGNIRVYPGNKTVTHWSKPRGQTIGYTPQLDCFEEIGSRWGQRREVLTFSAGSGICVRQRRSGGYGGSDRSDGVEWMTYRPVSATEGRDDITTLHLLRPRTEEDAKDGVRLVSGTANGDLQLIHLSEHAGEEVPKTYFITQGLGIRSSSLLQEPSHPTLLAASLDDTRLCLYPVDLSKPKTAPTSEVELRRPENGQRAYRAWSTNFLSPTHLAVGVGPSEEPVQVYEVTPSGLSKEPIRKFNLLNQLDMLEGEVTLSAFAKKSTSSVYPIVPLPPSSSSAAGHATNVFLSGAYDGIIRLHDLRSNRDMEAAYIDPTDESAIYSLLTRGQEKLIAGTSRHTLMKVFDLRLGAKAYSYLDASSTSSNKSSSSENPPFEQPAAYRTTRNWNLFLKPNAGTYPGRGGGNNWARRSAESSIYSLASPSPHSPYIYAGVENAVVEMAFTSITDRHADQAFFKREKGQKGALRGWRDKEIWDLAMYDQKEGLKLMSQRNVAEVSSMWHRARVEGKEVPADFKALSGLDERWRAGGS